MLLTACLTKKSKSNLTKAKQVVRLSFILPASLLTTWWLYLLFLYYNHLFHYLGNLTFIILEMNRDVVAEKIQLYTAKLDATRRQLEVVKTSFFKAKTATTKIKWPAKPPTEKMRLLLRIVSLFLNFSTLTRVFCINLV